MATILMEYTEGVFRVSLQPRASLPERGLVYAAMPVSLSQRLTCTTTGTANSQVPQEVVSNCNATKVHQILLILQYSMLDQYETKYMPVCVTN